MASSGFYRKFYPAFTSSSQNQKFKIVGGTLMCFNVFKLFDNPDAIDASVKTVQATHPNTTETGMDRLKLMFRYDEYGDISPELEMVSQGAMMGLFTGSIIGGTIHSRENYFQFLEKNQATTFYSHIDAKKRLQDKVYVGFFRGAWIWGWRLGLFTGSIALFTTAISVYRGKSSIIEYVAGGAITGSLYKFKGGPKAMTAGAVIGGFLGTLAGSISLALMYLTGTSMEEVRYWQYKWKEEYNENKLKRLRKVREKDMSPLIKTHEEMSTNDLLETLEESKQSQIPEHLESVKQSQIPENLESKQSQIPENLATPNQTQ